MVVTELQGGLISDPKEQEEQNLNYVSRSHVVPCLALASPDSKILLGFHDDRNVYGRKL